MATLPKVKKQKIIPNLHNKIKHNVHTLLRFGIVGSVGSGLNVAVYYAMTEFFSLRLNVSAMGAFGVAVISNYILNHQWTFSVENENRPANVRQFKYYLLGNLVGLLFNLFVLNIVVAIAGIRFHIAGQMLGIACGMVFNFLFAKKIVFAVVNVLKSDSIACELAP
jgi:putative flippase GtrA